MCKQIHNTTVRLWPHYELRYELYSGLAVGELWAVNGGRPRQNLLARLQATSSVTAGMATLQLL